MFSLLIATLLFFSLGRAQNLSCDNAFHIVNYCFGVLVGGAAARGAGLSLNAALTSGHAFYFKIEPFLPYSNLNGLFGFALPMCDSFFYIFFV